MRKNLLALTGWLLMAVVPFASAHHGFTGYYDSSKVIRIEGKVRKFAFINPHGVLELDAVSSTGEHVVYVIDLQARSQMTRLGIDASFFKPGAPLTVECFQAWSDPHRCEFGVGYFADGRSVTMRTIDKAESVFAADLALDAVGSYAKTIFGSWIRAGMQGDASGTGPTTGQESITAAGKAVLAAFDPLTDNPVVHCMGGSPVRNWGAPGLATAIFRKGGDIVIQHETMDIKRTIHMDRKTHPAGTKPSEMGHSIGHFEGETLVVDTANFTAGVLNGTILKSDRMTMQERISLNKDNGRLLISWVVNDPTYYSRPITGSQQLQRTGKKLLPYGCVPETRTR